jgi:hypothetical protein
VYPPNGVPGTTFYITANVKSPVTTTALIDLEVYDERGVRVYFQMFENQLLTAGQTRSFMAVQATSVWQAPGTYTVKVGVFSSALDALYSWNENASAYTISH